MKVEEVTRNRRYNTAEVQTEGNECEDLKMELDLEANRGLEFTPVGQHRALTFPVDPRFNSPF